MKKGVIGVLLILLVLSISIGFVFAAKGGIPGKPGGRGDDTSYACNDNKDNDGDGLVDYDGYCKNKKFCFDPDPGCLSPTDNDEYHCVMNTENCDGVDNDCDGQIDEGVCPTLNYYCDLDSDGYLGSDVSGSCNTYNCVPSNCDTTAGQDCNDDYRNINPGVTESCDYDGIDNDCDGQIDECSCFNNVTDDDETDVDCGGSCSGCNLGDSCNIDSDCALGTCVGGTCVESVDCVALDPLHNDASADRVNIVFVGLNYADKDKFIRNVYEAAGYPTYNGIGLMEMEYYKNNTDKINFWYVNHIFESSGDPSTSCTYCSNSQAYIYCDNLPNRYVANFCDQSFRSCAYYGGSSYNSVTAYDWPYSFDHEIQHQFPRLRDEYVESSQGDRPGAPNCAPDLESAQLWWSDLYNQTGPEGLLIGYYDGCSYVTGNYRSVVSSIMRARNNFKLGLVNGRQVLSVLDGFSGSPGGASNAMEVVLTGNPEDVTSYKVKEINAKIYTNDVKKEKGKPYKIKLKSGGRIFSQNFDVVDYLAIDDFTGQNIVGEVQEIPRNEVSVIIPLGKNAKYDKKSNKVIIGGKASTFSITGAVTSVDANNAKSMKLSLENEDGDEVIIYPENKMQARAIKEKPGKKVLIDNEEVDSELEIKNEKEGNKTKVKVMLSNGKNAEIKVMPTTASEKALERLRIKVCSEENNCVIELKEVGKGENTRPAYEVQIERHSKILGLFKKKMQVSANVDAETGEVIKIKKPWWAFIATEPAE